MEANKGKGGELGIVAVRQVRMDGDTPPLWSNARITAGKEKLFCVRYAQPKRIRLQNGFISSSSRLILT